MTDIIALFADPGIWLALLTLIVLEVVLGVDNLVFVAILSNKLPPEQQQRARRIGLGLALVMRLVLLGAIAWIVSLTAPILDLGLAGPLGEHGEPTFETALSGRDLILIAGGLFLLWKATKEIHHAMDPEPSGEMLDKKGHGAVGFWDNHCPDCGAQPRLFDRFHPDGYWHDQSDSGYGDCHCRHGRCHADCV